MNRASRPAVVVAILALTAAALLRQFAQPAPDEWFAHDQQVYLAMTQAPFAATPLARRAPASWRILPPLVAGAAGRLTRRGPAFGFFILTFASFACIPIAAMTLLRRIGVTPTTTMILGAVAGLAPPVLGYMSWDVVRIDPFGLLLVYLSAIAVVAERPVGLTLVLLALSLTKETVLLAAFFAVGWSALFARKMLPVALLATAACVVVRWVLLPFWLPSPAVDGFVNLDGFRGVIGSLSLRYVARRGLLATASTFNVLLPLAAMAVIRERRSARGWLFAASIAVAFSQTLFASDTQRVTAAAYPFVLILCGFELDRIAEDRRRLAGALLVAAQFPWLLVYGRLVPDLPGIRFVEILIFVASMIAAAVTWAWRPAVAVAVRRGIHP